MILWPRSIRARMALAFCAVLAAILAAFSAGVYALMHASLQRESERRARDAIAILIDEFNESPDEYTDPEQDGIVMIYAVLTAGQTPFESAAWNRLGLPAPEKMSGGPTQARWFAPDGHGYTLAYGAALIAEKHFEFFAADDAESTRRDLGLLAGILALALPFTLAAAFAASSFIARRLLAPISDLAAAAGRITEERLSERLPVEEPRDEFGRLATVFNQTLARLEEAFERLRRFSADASHELRTPLTALRSVGEVALRGPLPAGEYRATIGSMLEEADRLERLIEDLLVLTSENSRAYRARFAPLDLGELAQEVVELLRLLADERGQRLELAVAPGPRITADRTTLRQAIVNLVDNALKYTPDGGTVHVRVNSTESEGVLEVTDTGPGIAAEHHERVFERFYRIDRDRARATGGVGLGLSIARWAVDLHHGKIELDSALKRGSTFRIRIPTRPRDENALLAPEARNEKGSETG